MSLPFTDDAEKTVEQLARDGYDLSQITKMTGLNRKRVSEILAKLGDRLKAENRRARRKHGP